jgi:hypothetical protein
MKTASLVTLRLIQTALSDQRFYQRNIVLLPVKDNVSPEFKAVQLSEAVVGFCQRLNQLSAETTQSRHNVQ